LIKNLNIRPETLKLLEENIGERIYTLLLSRISLLTTKNMGNKSRNKQMELYQTKISAHQRKKSTGHINNSQNKRKYV
jgi:hypothetical protein